MTKAYLVGAGPGDPRLLTVAALEAIQTADIVLWDRLVSDEILALVNPAAEKIYVGKQEGEQERAQQTIFDHFAHFSGSERKIVRLKGGDPYIFGRGCEEFAHLQKHGYDVAIVPGISTAIGLPTLAGIPLTARNISSSFAVITGHSASDNSMNWHDYVKIDTLVILMAVKERVRIAKALIAAGRSAHEPIAFIENGSLKYQRVIKATLGQLQANAVHVESPAVLVIGVVAALPESSDLVDNLYAQSLHSHSEKTQELTVIGASPKSADASDTVEGVPISQQTNGSNSRQLKPIVEIEYCPKCRWLMRSSWMAQELLTTFEAELGGVMLQPSAVSGAFEVRVDGQIVWSRLEKGRFPEITELKRVVRDVAAPDKDLGHNDRKKAED